MYISSVLSLKNKSAEYSATLSFHYEMMGLPSQESLVVQGFQTKLNYIKQKSKYNMLLKIIKDVSPPQE